MAEIIAAGLQMREAASNRRPALGPGASASLGHVRCLPDQRRAVK